MKRIWVSFAVLGMILILGSCSVMTKNVNKSLLVGTWVHSFEENSTAGIDVYRPQSSMTFPPSMFRQVYQFNADNTAEYLVLHPADAHYMEKGKWTLDETGKIVEITDPAGKTVAKFTIIELTPTLLRITKV